MSRNIEGKIVVITGASSGLGKSTARHLAKLGTTVVLGARRTNRLDAIVKDIQTAGGKALPVTVDVTKRAEVEGRRVEETRCTLDFPWLYPPFPASCPFRSILAHRGLPPHRTTPCRFPAAGSSSGFTTSPQGSSPGSGQIVGRVLGT